MTPYASKIINTVRSMLLKLPFAKSPIHQSSLSIPKNLTAIEVSGNLVQNELAYRISAINEYGETLASDEVSITVGTQLDNVNIISSSYTPGVLPKGIYYYTVTATNENGETNAVRSFKVSLNGAPSPDWADTPSELTPDGMLPKGTFFYALTGVVNGKETSLSTFLEVETHQENSSVTLKFLPVEGTSAYNIYGRSRTMPKRIGTIQAPVYTGPEEVVVFKDNGSSIPKELAPTLNETTAGINIKWEAIAGNVKTYKIYGRTAVDANELRFLSEVPGDRTNYKDQGIKIPQYTPPLINQSGYANGVGIALKWDAVPNATGYRIYGRDKLRKVEDNLYYENKGLLATNEGNSSTTFVDTGILSPDNTILPPKHDTTDGISGKPGVVIPDGETIVINEKGILSVKGGIDSFLGRSKISNVKDKDVLVYNEKEGRFTNYSLKDLIYLLVTMSDETIVPIDDKFKEFKDTLIESLTIAKTFKEQVDEIKNSITLNQEEINKIKDVLGNPHVDNFPLSKKK